MSTSILTDDETIINYKYHTQSLPLEKERNVTGLILCGCPDHCISLPVPWNESMSVLFLGGCVIPHRHSCINDLDQDRDLSEKSVFIDTL